MHLKIQMHKLASVNAEGLNGSSGQNDIKRSEVKWFKEVQTWKKRIENEQLEKWSVCCDGVREQTRVALGIVPHMYGFIVCRRLHVCRWGLWDRCREIFISFYVYCPFFLGAFQDLLWSTSWKLFYSCNVKPKWAFLLPRRSVYHESDLSICPQHTHSSVASICISYSSCIKFSLL